MIRTGVGFSGWGIKGGCGGGLLLLLASCLSAAEPLNVLFILADDYGWRDVGVEGSDYYETPHLDRLAQQGVRFAQGYSTCQVCSPSRASLMTGKFPARHGITDWIGAAWGQAWNRNDRVLPSEYAMHLAHEEVTLAEAFRDAGYRTFFAGKWHLGSEGSYPEDHGFEFNQGGYESGSPRGGYFSPFANPKLKDRQPGEPLPERLAQETIHFLEEHHNEPFFAMLSFYSVHGPIQTSQALWKKYRDKAAAQGAVRSRFEIDRTLPVRQVQDCPIYAGMIEAMDQAIGEVLETLDRLDLTDSTIVVFTSDNGGVSSGDAYSTSNLPLRGGKGRQWEGGVRVPFYLRVPDSNLAGTTVMTPVTGADLYPTLLELTGQPLRPEQHADGVSLVPLLEGESLASRDLFWHYPHYGNQGGEPSAMIRSGSWKLIHYWEDGRDELYDLASDPGETTDVIEQQVSVASRLRHRLDRWLADTGARIPQADPRFDSARAAQQAERVRAELLPRLERQHAHFLDLDFEPNANWWGSQVVRD